MIRSRFSLFRHLYYEIISFHVLLLLESLLDEDTGKISETTI